MATLESKLTGAVEAQEGLTLNNDEVQEILKAFYASASLSTEIAMCDVAIEQYTKSRDFAVESEDDKAVDRYDNLISEYHRKAQWLVRMSNGT